MPSGSARAVGLFGLHSQTTVAPRVGDGRPDGRPVQREPGRFGQARHRHDGPAALLGHDAVHRVGRDRDDGAATARDEGLGDDVEDLVGAGADDELARVDAVAGGGRLDQAAVVGRRVFGEGRLEPPGGQQAVHERRRGGGGVQVEADDRGRVDAVPGGDLLVGRLPRVRRRGGRRGERHRGRAHRGIGSSSNRISTASRWASRPSASASVPIVSRIDGEAVAIDPLDLAELAVRLDRQRRRTRGQGRRSAGRGWRPWRSRRPIPAPTARRRWSRRCGAARRSARAARRRPTGAPGRRR